MHGKITHFTPKTATWMAVDSTGRNHEFNINSWYDHSGIPTVGMYVEYNLGDKNKIIEIHSSRYQSFINHPLLKEDDFWSTEDDEQLALLEEQRDEELISSKYQDIKNNDIAFIKPTFSYEDGVKFLLSTYFEVLQNNQEIMLENDHRFDFDYEILKKTLQKTMFHLMSMDKKITADEFAQSKQKIVEVEYLYGLLLKTSQPDDFTLTKESYLKYQVDYQAVLRYHNDLDATLSSTINKSKILENEITSLTAKIKAISPKEDKTKSTELLNKKVVEKRECDKFILVKTPTLSSLKNLLTNFEKNSIDEFPEVYKNEKELLKKELKSLLNKLADSLDTEIFTRASESQAVASHFYIQTMDTSFSTMTFVKYYLDKINVKLMKDYDKKLFSYYNDYKDHFLTKVAVISSDIEVSEAIKISLLSQHKHIKVIVCNRAIEFTTMCDHSTFDIVFLDSKLKGCDYLQLIQMGKSSPTNKKTTYVVFDS